MTSVQRLETSPAEFVITDDGRSVLVRALRPGDRERYETAVLGLSARSRYLRFGAPVPRLSPRQLDRLMDIDGHRHVAHAALTLDGITVVGVVRYIRSESDAQTAEIAIAIADRWQGSGLGRRLLDRVIEHARAGGVRRLLALTLRENRRATGVARACGFRAAGESGLYVTYEKRL